MSSAPIRPFVLLCLSIVILPAPLSIRQSAATKPGHLDASLPTEQRLDNLISQMTVTFTLTRDATLPD